MTVSCFKGGLGKRKEPKMPLRCIGGLKWKRKGDLDMAGQSSVFNAKVLAGSPPRVSRHVELVSWKKKIKVKGKDLGALTHRGS